MSASVKCASILVVEDDEMILRALRELLESEGYQVATEKNGRLALEALETKVQHPCLILLDMFMPVMDGWHFLEHLKSMHSDLLTYIPIIITSAAGDVAKEAAKQVHGFIKKPYDLELLLKMVEKYCGPGHLTNEVTPSHHR